jgi:hypothetical protein
MSITGADFLLGIWVIACILLMFAPFIWKHKILVLPPATLWAILAINRLSAATVKNFSDFNWSMGYFCIAMAIICLSMLVWAFKITPKEPPAKDEREQWEIDDEVREKRLSRYRKHRPKHRPVNPYDRY